MGRWPLSVLSDLAFDEWFDHPFARRPGGGFLCQKECSCDWNGIGEWAMAATIAQQ